MDVVIDFVLHSFVAQDFAVALHAEGCFLDCWDTIIVQNNTVEVFVEIVLHNFELIVPLVLKFLLVGPLGDVFGFDAAPRGRVQVRFWGTF